MIAGLAAFLFSSCSLVYTDQEDCDFGLHLRFKYDYNMSFGDAFPTQVSRVSVYVFDEDGKCYYIGTRPNPEGVGHNGDWYIYIQEVDLENWCLVGDYKMVWNGAMRKAEWPEGPHLYKKDGYYYILHAEGGTGPAHAICVARSKDIWGPYENNFCNPILNHRHLGFDYPINLIGTGPTYEVQDIEFPGQEEWIFLDPFVFFNLSAGTILKYIHPTEGIKYCYVSEVDLENETITLSSIGTYKKIIQDGIHTFNVDEVEYEYTFYIPDSINEPNPIMYITSIANNGTHIEGIETIGIGWGSHSEGYRTIAKGTISHTEGICTSTSDFASHAEGAYTKASGDTSHAEGCYTSASGTYSHAEGEGTEASDFASHAEGQETKASGYTSHAEGCETEASGHASHTEGQWTKASGAYSHAEGFQTKAYGNYQHVQGKYNISDDNLAHIIGNGTSNSKRSNAHTLDWEGNAWFAGDVYVKGSGQDDTENVHKLSYDSIEQQNANSPHKNIKFWVGTQEELDAIEDRDDSCLYFTTGGEDGEGEKDNSTYEKLENKTNIINENSTDEQYPSAKAVYNAISNINLPYSYGTEDLVAGESPLAEGHLYFVIE